MEPSPGIFHSLQVRLSLVIALLIVVVAFFSSRPQSSTLPSELVAKDAVQEGIHLDLDSDGLEAWQEDLWGTDPKNADTDGDGTTDGEEVRVGRVPTVKGPKDKQNEVTAPTTTPLYYDDDPSLSTTEVVSRDILAAYLGMKKAGTYTERSIEDLTDQVAAKSRDREPIVIDYFGPEDVVTVAGDLPEQYKTYANTLGTIFAQFRDDSKEGELVTFARAVETKDPSILSGLGEFERAYRTIAKLLISTPAPQEIASLHLTVTNSYVDLAESIRYLQRFEEDPVVNIIGVELYSGAIIKMNSVFPMIKQKLIERGTILREGDPGASVFGMMGQ